jgi:nitrogen regulatory protein PII
MKLVIAIIRPENLAAVQAALKTREVRFLSVSEVFGDGDEPGWTGMYRGTAFRIRRPRLRLEVAVKDQVAQAAVEAIVRTAYPADAAQTGEVKVVVIPLDMCVLSVAQDEDAHPVNRGQ